jgi:hypothetical protein
MSSSVKLTKEQIAKISNLIKTKNIDSLQMALHLLESLEATEQDWLSAFNSNVMRVCINDWTLDLFKKFAECILYKIRYIIPSGVSI